MWGGIQKSHDTCTLKGAQCSLRFLHMLNKIDRWMDYNLRIALSCASDGKPSRTDTLLKKKHFWTSSSFNHETIFVEEIPWRAKHEFKLKRNLVKKCHWASLQNEHCSWPRSTVNAEITKWMSACAFYWTCMYIYMWLYWQFFEYFL